MYIAAHLHGAAISFLGAMLVLQEKQPQVLMKLLHFFFPFISWLQSYSLGHFKKDAIAGLTVGLVLVPQSMANAQLAGLPVYYGLYAAMLPTLVGGIWGSSRQMVTSSVAVVSLMAGAALAPFNVETPADYLAYMSLLTVMVGGCQLLLGVFKLGIVVNFLSLPVISGFTNASAIIIATLQLPRLFGVSVDAVGPQYQTVLRGLASAWNYTHWGSVSMGLIAVLVIWGAGRISRKIPAVLAAVVVTVCIAWLVPFGSSRVVEVGAIESDEVHALLLRLAQQESEVAAIGRVIAELEQQQPDDAAARLEIKYKVAEQQLYQSRIMQKMHQAREHLRQLLFVAEEDAAGRYTFRQVQSPHIVPDAPPDVSGVLGALAGLDKIEEMLPHALPDLPAAPRLSVRSFLPAADPQHGIWRLQIGKSAPSLDAIPFFCGGTVVGAMPSHLPKLSLPMFSWGDFLLLLPQALIISFVGFAESISIGRYAANVGGYRLDANQELVGQGLANIVGGLTRTSPVSGSFSSSAVNIASGAQTGIACVVASFFSLLVLLFCTDTLQYLAQPVLAVIIIRAALALFHGKVFAQIWSVQWYDGCIALVTFVATLYFAPHLDYGLALGVILSLASFFYRSMRPKISALSCAPDRVLREVNAFGLRECRHIAIVQFQGSLFFANAGALEDHILWRMENQKELRHVHLVCSGITHIDASGEDTLGSIVLRLQKAGISVSLSGVVGSVAEVLARTGVLRHVGLANVYLTPREALCAIYGRIRHDSNCTECPLSDLICLVDERKE